MRRLFSFPAALAAGLIFLTFWTCSTRFDDPDLWWHLKVGEVIWSTHHLPIADQYSFSAFGHAWIAHEWLSELVLFTVYKAGGYRGLMLWMCAIASAYVVLTYLLSVSWSGNWKVSFLGGILALWFLTVTLAIRPALLSHLFLALELLLLSTGVARLSRIAWALPVLFAVWANCHGSYLFGLGLLTIAVAWRCLKLDQGRLVLACDRSTTIRLLMIWVFSLFAPFVNPVGASLLVYPINLLRQHPESVSSVQEWAALDIHEPRAAAFALVAAFILIAAIARWRQVRSIEWAFLLIAAGMAILHVRMLPIFGIICAPVVCRILAAWWDNYDPNRDYPFINAFLLIVAAFFSISVLPNAAEIESQIAANEPVKAVAEIRRSHIPGPILNEYVWGGYLIWANPGQPVFIDGRFDIFAWTGVFRAYGHWALLEEDPQRLLNQYGIRTCLIRASSPMANVLPYLPGWRRAYADEVAVVYTRAGGETRPQSK